MVRLFRARSGHWLLAHSGLYRRTFVRFSHVALVLGRESRSADVGRRSTAKLSGCAVATTAALAVGMVRLRFTAVRGLRSAGICHCLCSVVRSVAHARELATDA